MNAETETTPAPKVAPETMVLRGAPARVTRFRKEVVIGAVVLGSAALFGTAWYALSPGTSPLVARPELAVEMDSRSASDVLAGAPTSYDEVPQLGPPLPGDLGRPILRAQQRGAGGDDPSSRFPVREEAMPTTAPVERRDVEAERLAATRRAARESTLLVALTADRRSRASESELGSAEDDPGAARTPGIAPTPASRTTEERGPRPASTRVLTAGTIIPASLITGINSDAPGIVTAQVTEGVYDSATGRTLLIPQGARLIGDTSGSAAFGQSRTLIVWSRLILPDGSSVQLDMPASDSAGYAGLSDQVDRHTGRLLRGVALATLLGVGTETTLGGDSGLVRAIREASQQSASRAGDQIVAKELGVAPTITVRPGWPVRVLVSKDLTLMPWSDPR